MSLRRKLVLLVVLLTTTLLGALGLWVRVALDGWVAEVVDAELSRRAEVLLHELHREGEGEALELDEDGDLGTRGLPFRVEDARGAVLLGSQDWPAAALRGEGFSTHSSAAGAPLRVLSVAFSPKGSSERLVLRVAAPLAGLSRLAERFRSGLVLALVLAALISTAGAWLISRWFLAPLGRLAGAVEGQRAQALRPVDTEGLGPELAALAQAFNGLLARVAVVQDGQRDFVARASHALRTPLASMLAQAEVTLQRERSPEAYRAALEALAASTREAAQLTAGLLALARAEAGAATQPKEDVPLEPLAQELLRLFAPRAEAAGLALRCTAEPGLRVQANRARLRELLDALLDNAVRYTPRGGAVAFAARREATAVVLEVSDDGPGIAPEERARVFERFYRGAAAARSGQSGSGLGLSVVRALADGEGAQVELADAPGGGTQVTLTFGAGG